MKECCLALIDIRPKDTPWHIKECVYSYFTLSILVLDQKVLFLHFSMLDVLIVLLSCAVVLETHKVYIHVIHSWISVLSNYTPTLLASSLA